MKKIFVLLLTSLIFLSGCSIKKVDNENIDEMVSTILNKKLNLYNQHSSGYKYYIPRGMSLIDSTSYNEKMFSNGYTYYLYVDVVSYHFKKDFTYKINDKAYFSKKLKFNNKSGYIEINKEKDLYFIQMMLNYSKIEVYVPKDYINDAIINASYILSSIKFNDTTIKALFDDTAINFKEEKFELFKPREEEDNSLNFDEEKVTEDIVTDEDIITTDETTTDDSATNSNLQ
jgi:hypothetical protein